MFRDYIINGAGQGEVGAQVVACGYDPGLMRPYTDDTGATFVTINTRRKTEDGKPIFERRMVQPAPTANTLVINGPTSLRKNEWQLVDLAVVKAARQRLRAWSDLAAANTFGGFDGMSKILLEHETMSDPSEALVDFDGLSEGRNDAPKFQLEGLPLPITHAGFHFSSRRLALSRNTGTPLDMTLPEAAARRVAEKVEKTLIGTVTGLTYGNTSSYGQTPKVYGYTNHPLRNTKTNLTAPTGSNAASTVADVLTMIESLANDNFFGPFMLYHSTDWDKYMDNDYILTGGNVATQTLRNRLRAIEQISDVRRLDFLTNTFTLLLVQMTSDVARAVNGMDLVTVQWESRGGMQLNFKVMCIQVPQLRADFNGNMGLLHATTA